MTTNDQLNAQINEVLLTQNTLVVKLIYVVGFATFALGLALKVMS